MDITTIGLDLAKSIFQVHGVDANGRVVIRKSLRRAQMLPFFARLPSCLVGVEACGTSHYWARELIKLGHEVRLMPPAYVKPYVKRSKTDAADAEAVCEAVTRPTMRFVPVKSPEQQAALSMHRAREAIQRGCPPSIWGQVHDVHGREPVIMNAKTILISGAGIGGPTLAFWLQAAGFEPTLIEHATTVRTGGYVIDFWGLGYDIAERMGLAGHIDRVGYHIREVQIVSDRGKRVAGFGTRVFRELTGGRFVTLGRSDLSRLLFEKIKHTTEVIFDNDIIGLQENADGVQVRFKRGGGRRFDLVIGADGLHSTVRKLVFGPQELFEKHLGYIVAAFEVCGYRPRDEDVYVIYSEPGRMVARFALHDDRTLFLFVFVADAGSTKAMTDLSAQKAVLRERFGTDRWECQRILGELDRTQDLYFDRVSQIKMKRWSKGRVALVGDAAFCVSLMAGQGSALAMTAAYVLAGEIVKGGGRHAEAFGKYEGLLRAYIGSKQQGAERFAAAFAPKTRFGLFLRNQVIKAFAVPRLARLAFGRDIIDTLQLPDYGWPAL